VERHLDARYVYGGGGDLGGEHMSLNKTLMDMVVVWTTHEEYANVLAGPMSAWITSTPSRKRIHGRVGAQSSGEWIVERF
jgi:hypothetical protein